MDEAFSNINNNTSGLELLDKTTLINVLQRHLVAGVRFQIPVGHSELRTVSGDLIELQRNINDIFSENVIISLNQRINSTVKFQILTKDGIIHGVDTLLQGQI